MNSQLVFGTYIPVNSPLHRLDARAKLLMCVWYVITVFFAYTWWTTGWLLLALLGSIYFSHISLKLYWQGIRPFVWIIVITAAFQVLFSSGGTSYWHWGWLSVTSDGLINSLILIYRFIVIITASTVLTATTPTLQLAQAFASLLTPLKYLHVPIDKMTLMLSIALRFVPTIMTETHEIINAQKMRGMRFNQGGVMARLHHILPIFIPLFVNSFQHSEELAIAMEARGYVAGAPRTQFRQLHWQWRDTAEMIIMAALTAVLVLLRRFL